MGEQMTQKKNKKGMKGAKIAENVKLNKAKGPSNKKAIVSTQKLKTNENNVGSDAKVNQKMNNKKVKTIETPVQSQGNSNQIKKGKKRQVTEESPVPNKIKKVDEEKQTVVKTNKNQGKPKNLKQGNQKKANEDVKTTNEGAKKANVNKKKTQPQKKPIQKKVVENENQESNDAKVSPKKKNKKVKQKPSGEAADKKNNPKTAKLQVKRAGKKAKLLERIETNRKESQQTYKDTHPAYLSTWKNNQSEWKFNKRMQKWLRINMYKEDMVSEENWDILVEYFNSSKGMIRVNVLKEAVAIIEEKGDDSDDENEENSVKIRRARSIVQSIQE